MTRLSYSNLRIRKRTAGRNFRAKCGHKVKKGEEYVSVDEYSLYQNHHDSQCLQCAERSLGVKIEK